ncbi:FadR/GntR family transcriptional regulator [Actinoplanes sp. N902-109]|uniref:FadR/GntR family transcriptional regulator n=1 Tax=Actinoplanes sp. (strain N902-109) TaxID=649831 RepID=UPI000329482A|nr:FCD domain-containing protein [Actinoplanes sp. N902-109]AGL16899.1 GntR family transcriptional regulator [Actinoplanes sp. N902-109]
MPRLERPASLAEQVADQLRRRIADGEFPVGALLPTEHELTRELGVSRNSVREGVRSLVHAGLLGARAGYGTYVIATSDLAPALARRLERDRADDVAEVRLVLEREGARLAAHRATAEQVQALTEALAARRAATDGRGYAAADIAFHQLLLAASGNALLAELYRGTGGNEQALLRHIHPDDDMTAARPRLHAVDAAHEAIVAAISRRDPDAAAAAADHMVRLVQEEHLDGEH